MLINKLRNNNHINNKYFTSFVTAASKMVQYNVSKIDDNKFSIQGCQGWL